MNLIDLCRLCCQNNTFRPYVSEMIGLAKSVHNVFILRGDMREVRCLSCGSVVGSLDQKNRIITLDRVTVKKVASVEYRITCAGARETEDHGHRYRCWSSVMDVRRTVRPIKTYYNSRGRQMSYVCEEARPGCLFEIIE